MLLEAIRRGYEVAFTDMRPDGPELRYDTDRDTGGAFNGGGSLNDALVDLLDLIVDAARAKPTKPLARGHRKYFSMDKHQSALSLHEGCRTVKD